MAHIARERSRFERTEPAWLPIGGQFGDLTNKWAKRDDIVAFVGQGAGHGAAACFVPAIAEMEVNVTAAFGEGVDPAYVGNFTERETHFEHPAVAGAILHEAMHARHSSWDLEEQADRVLREDKNPFAHKIIEWFEETRIERYGVEEYPDNRAFLRACALKLVCADMRESAENAEANGHRAMTHLVLLTLARVTAGVLEPEDVTPVQEAAERLWGTELLSKLRSVWVAAQGGQRDDLWEPLYAQAKKWIELLKEAGHDTEEQEMPEWLAALLGAMIGGMPNDGEGEGDGEGEKGEGKEGGSGGKGGEGEDKQGEGTGKPAPGQGTLEKMAEEAETRARGEATAQAVAEQAAEAAKAKAETAKEIAGHEQAAALVFGRGTGPGPADTRSRLMSTRPPTGVERAAAVKLAKDLERAKYRDRVEVKTTHAAPPGRLSMREAMANSADVARGAMRTRQPWTSKTRKHTDDPELLVGVMVDISGSMREVMAQQGVLAWALSEAVRRIQGKAAVMYYGNDAFPVLSPGQVMEEVSTYSASDGTERFDKAFTALNGRMNLLGSTGARLLVIVSDLYHTGYEQKAARKWVDRCQQDGVAVLVLAPDDDMVANAKRVAGPGASVIEIDERNITATTAAVGAAAVKELTKAGGRDR